MIEKSKEDRHVYILPPCPSYDVEGMESWLTDMAKDGLILTKDGVFAGIAAFKQSQPQYLKYRLEAAQKSTSMWADDGGEPDQEAVELSDKYGWQYIAKRGSFYIYRSSEPGARELNTDPEVQAIALNMVRKRQYDAVFRALLWLILYPILQIRGDLLITMIHVQTWFFLLGAFLLLWLFADSLAEVIQLGKLRKKLQNSGTLDHAKDWKKRMVWHHTKNALQIVLIMVWLCILLHNWSASVLDEDKTQLVDYHEDPPFATLADFAGDGEYSYRMIASGHGFNTVREWADWLSPYNIDWSENAEIKRADGSILEGGLYVDYHEAVNSWIAEKLALEYYHQDKQRKFKQFDTPALDVDYAVAYMNATGFPTIVIQEGNVVVHATFNQTSPGYIMEIDEWAEIMAYSISK
ncbi:MAG: DUF2812 domain-containing protein [Negativicutes bacterium]|nr:DUF2812 domain-containing protein [Negativicutes bacterium]